MASVRCPMCGKPNPTDIDECMFCRARLKPLLASTPVDSQPIKPGEEPVERDTTEFDKVKPGQQAPIHPGEAPTKKNTAELEAALPAWLRSLREGKSPAEGEPSAATGSAEAQPAAFPPTASSEPPGELPDWLSGLDKAAAEEEDIPDWLAGLRSEQPGTPTQSPEEEEPALELGNADWMARLGSKPQAETPEPPVNEEPAASAQPAPETSPGPAAEEGLPDWLESLEQPPTAAQEPATSPPQRAGEKVPEWLSGLPAIAADSGEAAPANELPDWLNQLEGQPPETTPEIPGEASKPATPNPAEKLPDWLSQSMAQEAGAPPEMSEKASLSGSDRLSSVKPEAEAETPAAAENVPEWLKGLEGQSSPGSGTSTVFSGGEATVEGSPSPAQEPDWLSRLKADVDAAQEAEKHKDDYEVSSEPPVLPKATGPLPDWLAGIQDGSSASAGTPALISEEKDDSLAKHGETAFSMEAPDWLSRLKPEQGEEKGTGKKEEPAEPANLEAAELPSWVQAMRPVESVVAEATTAEPEVAQVTEQSGPLAGLHGVLPASPGLGVLRKPPAYSIKLQVSDGQQRYAAQLEHLVAGETSPHTAKTRRLTSNQLWRWLVAALLILAAILPIINQAQVAPPTSLLSSDKGATALLIDSLPANVPVLAVFDYDPALAGELETTAAPLFDELLRRGTPLALLSSSPTGPALAEHFIQTTPLVNSHGYQSGDQYVNLGYLAGGPAGMLDFADDPAGVLPSTVDGQPAWEAGPLKGVRSLNDFAAFFVLTDNSDTARNWIEQAGPRLGQTPMVMVISAQAGPIIRPYFDSGQLKGFVSGLQDAKIYEQFYSRPGLAYRYWGPFSSGVLVAAILILVSAVWGASNAWRERRAGAGGEA